MHTLLKVFWVLCRDNNIFAFIPFQRHTTGIPFQQLCSVHFGPAAQDKQSTGPLPRAVALARACSLWSTWEDWSPGKDQLTGSQCTEKGQHGCWTSWKVSASFTVCLAPAYRLERLVYTRQDTSKMNNNKQMLALFLRAVTMLLSQSLFKQAEGS